MNGKAVLFSGLLSLALVSAAASVAEAQGKGNKRNKPKATPVTVTLDPKGSISGDEMGAYEDGVDGVSAILNATGNLQFDPGGSRLVDLDFGGDCTVEDGQVLPMSGAYPVFMIVALVDPDAMDDVEGGLAGMSGGDTGDARLVLNFPDSTDSSCEFRLRMGENIKSGLPLAGTDYPQVTCSDPSDPNQACAQWTLDTSEGATARIFRYCSTKGKGRKDSMSQVGDCEMPHGMIIDIK